MKKFPEPTVLVSRCLEFDSVRYDAKTIPSRIVKDLEPYVNYIKVCPEVEIGLGIPRDPIRIVKSAGEYRLIQPATGRDVTEEMDRFTDQFISRLPEVDGFIFKSGSPTIGIRNIKVYSGVKDAAVIEKSSGFFANKILAKYSGYPIEENDRLRNNRIRHDFLTELFTLTGFRKVREKGSARELARFHKENHYLFLMYSPEYFNEMENIIKELNARPILHLLEAYETILRKLFTIHPGPDSYIRIAGSIFSGFSGNVPADEIRYFEGILDRYSRNLLGLDGLLEILKLYILRYDRTGTENDGLFSPYPEQLQTVIDENRDRNYWK